MEGGRRVLIIGSHPWQGETGVITGGPRLMYNDSVELYYEVLLDKGIRCYVEPKDIIEI